MAIMGLMAPLSWRGLDGNGAGAGTDPPAATSLLGAAGRTSPSGGADLMPWLPCPHHTADWDGQVLHHPRSSAIPDEGALGGLGPAAMWTAPASGCAGSRPAAQRAAPGSQAWQQAAQWARNPGDAEPQRRSRAAAAGRLAGALFSRRRLSNPMSSSGRRRATLDAVAFPPDGVRLQLDLAPGPGWRQTHARLGQPPRGRQDMTHLPTRRRSPAGWPC